jgi:hypothetical protein
LELLPLGQAGTRGASGLALKAAVRTDSRVEALPGLCYHWLHVCDTVKEIGRVRRDLGILIGGNLLQLL